MTAHCMTGHWFMEAIRTRLRLVSSMLEGNRFDKAWRLHPGLTGPPTKQTEVERINREYEKLKGPRPRPLTLADFLGNGRYR